MRGRVHNPLAACPRGAPERLWQGGTVGPEGAQLYGAGLPLRRLAALCGILITSPATQTPRRTDRPPNEIKNSLK